MLVGVKFWSEKWPLRKTLGASSGAAIDFFPVFLSLLISLGVHGAILLSGTASSPQCVTVSSVKAHGSERIMALLVGPKESEKKASVFRPPVLKKKPFPLAAVEPQTIVPGAHSDQMALEAPSAPEQQHSAVTSSYYARDVLDEHPQALSEPDLSLLSGDWPGRIELTLFIEIEGEVGFVAEHQQLTDLQQSQLLEAFKEVRFTPGKISGLPVKSRIRVEVFAEDFFQPVLTPAQSVIISRESATSANP